MAQKFQIRRSHKFIFGSILVLALVALSFQNFIEPAVPIRNIDTKTVQMDVKTNKYTPTTNFLPTTEYTQDGRLALAWRRGSKGPLLFLTRPETVKDHLFSKLNEIMGSGLVKTNSFDKELDVVAAHAGIKATAIGKNMKMGGRSLLCERTEQIRNPVVCESGFDCYQLVLIVSYYEDLENGNSRYKLVSTDVHVQVGKPKTAQAYLEKVTMLPGTVKIGPTFEYPILAEPTIAGDSRLLVTRLSSAEVTLSDLRTKKRQINLVYSVYSRGEEQCDVTKWKHFHPISHAHYDTKNQMKERYKFARFPIRDSLGNLVPNGEEFGGSYPWMDRHATNLFFTTFGYNSFYNFDKAIGSVVTPFPDKRGSTAVNAEYFNIDGARTYGEYAAVKNLIEASGPVGGFSVSGFWTHGKVVLLDGLINNADFLFRISDKMVNDQFDTKPQDGVVPYRIGVERQIQLYRGSSYEVVGSVRDKGDEIVDYARMLTPNSTFASSLENRLNYNKNVFPVTPRDIVWHFGTSRHAEELAFDDYNSMFMLINAEMTAALEAEVVTVAGRERSMRHLVGYHKGKESLQIDGFPRQIKTSFPALVQNSGTAPDSFMTLPYYGKIDMRYSRIEPIAKGGIFGKGLWLEGQGSLQFQIPKQNANPAFSIVRNKNWYAGVFLDGRADYALEDRVDLMTFGNTSIRLKKSRPGTHLFDRVLFVKNGKEIGRVVFPGGLVPWKAIWSHIGISFEANKSPEVFFNGLSIGQAQPLGTNAEADLFNLVSLAEGTNIYLGKNPTSSLPGIKGWFDEFKVVARIPTYEEACNYARGTLVALSLNAAQAPEVAQFAARYPSSTHGKIAQAIFEENSRRRFACHNRYFFSNRPNIVLYAEDHAHLKNLPEGSRSIREDILGTKNMLVYGRPRPNFSSNKFCLSCHISSHPFAEMNLAALQKFPKKNMEADARRQPMQPDRYMRGVIPAGYFGSGMPSQRILASKTDVDKFIHPAHQFIDVRWNQLGSKYRYSIDVRDASSGTERSVGACISTRILKNSNLYRMDGKCVSVNNFEFPLTHEVKVRICYTGTGKWTAGNVKCSRYIPLNLHNDGVLDIFLNK